MEKVGVVIPAAGSGQRMEIDDNKVFLALHNKPVLIHSLEKFSKIPWVDTIVVVAKASDIPRIWDLIDVWQIDKVSAVVCGGAERQDSVYQGLQALPADTSLVLIHDAARPLVARSTLEDVLAKVRTFQAVGVGVPVKDTIKEVNEGQEIIGTPPRDCLWAVQTPQAFVYPLIMRAYQHCIAKKLQVTDDCAMVELLGEKVYMVRGSYSNIKITTKEDLPVAEALLGFPGGNCSKPPSVGMGYDVHRLVPERKLILGGVEIDNELGLLGHSDADVAVHALMDALLGAAGLGDIGRHFPDTDPAYKGISSIELLNIVVAKIAVTNLQISNVDVTIVAQRPKLAPYIGAIQERLAFALKVSQSRVNIKATTTEHLGFAGRGEGIAAYAVATLC